MVPSVFLSSTFSDFTKERDILRCFLPLVDVHVRCGENIGATGCTLSKTLEQRIDDSDMVVLLIGTRYGCEDGGGTSWTQTEIEHAIRKKKPIFAYVRSPAVDHAGFVDRDEEKQVKLRAFVKMVEKSVHVVPRYTEGEYCHLVAMVIRDVDRHAETMRQEERDRDYSDGFG